MILYFYCWEQASEYERLVQLGQDDVSLATGHLVQQGVGQVGAGDAEESQSWVQGVHDVLWNLGDVAADLVNGVQEVEEGHDGTQWSTLGQVAQSAQDVGIVRQQVEQGGQVDSLCKKKHHLSLKQPV